MLGRLPVVLIVDDEPRILTALRRVLRRQSLEVRVALTAEDALEQMAQGPVDVMVTDYDLPGLNGHQLLERVRRSKPGCRCILHTAAEGVELDGVPLVMKGEDPARLPEMIQRFAAAAVAAA